MPDPKVLTELQMCETLMIPWAVIIGETDMEGKFVTLRHVQTRKEERVERAKLVQTLREKFDSL